MKHFGYGLKINTVVNSKNFHEDMSDFIRFAKPKRWKLLQVLPIKGQNDLQINDFKITDQQFQFLLTTTTDFRTLRALYQRAITKL